MYRPCCTAEADIGMLYYMTDCDGTGGRLKKEPQDFVVEEIADEHPRSENGRYTIADITSTNWETNRLIRLLSRSMRISREKVGFAGTKDKRAVTTQRMSFECEPSKLDLVELEDIQINHVFRSDRPVRMGDLKGNRFTINVRDTDTSPAETKDTVSKILAEIQETGGFPNYYGIQRFGIARPVTHLVGEQIVRGDLRKAVEIYLFHPSEFEDEEIRNARQILSRCDGDYSSIDFILPKLMGFEQTLVDYLRQNPGDYKGAIESMPTNLQMMFTHAYQSYLYNFMLSRRMEEGMPLNEPVEGDTVIPVDADGVPSHEEPVTVTQKNIRLVQKQVSKGKAYVAASVFGSDGRFSEGRMGEIERKVISDAGLVAEDFIIPGLPHCCASGDWREILCKVSDLSWDTTDDGYSLRFYLTKGNYATCLMREFLKTDVRNY